MGGTIRATYTAAGYLASRGFDVEILSVFRAREAPFFDPLPQGVRVTALDDRRPGAPSRPTRQIRALLCRLPSVLEHRFERSSHWNAWVDLQLVRRLRRRPGVLITTRPNLNLIVAYLAPPGLIKIGIEHVNLDAWSPRLVDWFETLYPNLDAFVTLTERDRAAYANLLDGQLPVEAIPNIARPLGGPAADLASHVIVSAGRFSPQKGFGLLVTAFADIAADHPEWTLRIFGTGPIRAQIRDRADGLGLNDRVELPGSSSDLGAELAKASIFVLSSRREGFPLVLVEAMSKGLAVASFDCLTGPREIITDRENGLLIPPNDTQALVAALRELVDDEPLRHRLAANAAETARDYTIDAIGPRWEALVTRLAKRHAISEARDGSAKHLSVGGLRH
jgi:glycosyltransferase involved in cell wall biosynthesis